MAASLGSLVVSLGLDAADFTSGLTKSQYQAQRFADDLTRSVKQVAVVLGASLSAAAFSNLIRGSIDAADHLNDLSKKTGIAVETLGGIGFAASQSGGDLESASAAAGKLNKTLAEAASGNKGATEFFRVLGVEVKNAAGETKTADQAMIEIADRFSQFSDGPEKAALALRGFGKAGADNIPLLNEGGRALQENIDYYRRFGGVTTEVAQQADAFNDALGKLNLIGGSLGRQLAAELLPSLQAVADAFLAAKENSDLFAIATGAVKTVFDTLVVLAANVAFVFKATGREIGAIAAQLVALGSLNFTGFKAISEAVKEDGVRARQELDAFERRVLGGAFGGGSQTDRRELARRGRSAIPFGQVNAPGLAATGGGDPVDNSLRKMLDGQVKGIRAFADEQRDAFQFANRYVANVYAAGNLDLQSFVDTQASIRRAELNSQVQSYDREIAALQAFRAKAKPEDRIDADNRIAEAVSKRSSVVQRASQDEVLAVQQNQQAIEQLNGRYRDFQATLAGLSGDEAGAAQIRIAQQVKEAQRLINAVGGDQGQVDVYRERLQGAESLNAAQQEYTQLLDRAGAAEERLFLTAQASGASELDTLRAVGSVRKESLQQLGLMVEKANELAAVLGTPEAARFAEELALQFQRAAAEVDPLLQKVRDVGREISDSITSSLEDAIVSGGSFRDVLKGIEQDLIRVGTRELITKPLGDALTGIIGGNGQSSGGGGALGSVLGSLGVDLGIGSTAKTRDGLPVDTAANALRVVTVGGNSGNDPFAKAAGSLEGITGKVESIFTKAGSGIQDLLSSFSDLLSGVGEALSSAISSLLGGGLQTGSEVGSALSSVFGASEGAKSAGADDGFGKFLSDLLGGEDSGSQVAAFGALTAATTAQTAAVASATAAETASLAAVTASVGVTDAAFLTLAAAASSAAAALAVLEAAAASSAGSTGGSSASSLFGLFAGSGGSAGYGSGGGLAIGGPARPNTLYQVGERGPEVFDDGSRQWLLTGSKGGVVDPNPYRGSSGKSVNQVNHFHLPGPVDRRTQSQMSAEMARRLTLANARLN